VAAAHGQLGAADDDADPTALAAHLLDVGERDEHRAVDPDEAGRRPLLGQRRQRGAHEVGAVGGVQARVVALRLDVGDLGAVDEAGDPTALDGDLHVTRRRGTAGLHHPAYGLGEALLAHRLEDVVDGAQLEGRDGVLLVGGHEDDRRRGLEAGQHLSEVEPGEAGHLDVEEDRVDLLGLQHPQRLGRGVAAHHLADAGVAAEQEGELVQRRALVVDDEDLERCHTCTPGANFGTRTITLVPAPGAVSTTRP
jgi:hypothetical protein